ncbi:hypothetical protein MGG_16145 [Pyricularia oryzae 70-15]|uniref:Bromo domain-containing protein n=1 Tax=Pyricularia oryzae (strain 70-15 / ATCC MYA-4617 / FGSC 8958) TaxID=242507 RepID=G4MKP7_PYRO7|nr:uncharacterized protein MGG_16145 [Pyricularia oryzae 70-15]EHA56737.1 hypothetical protein MGG_16145 [Pyricularia oryzae 70-15]
MRRLDWNHKIRCRSTRQSQCQRECQSQCQRECQSQCQRECQSHCQSQCKCQCQSQNQNQNQNQNQRQNLPSLRRRQRRLGCLRKPAIRPPTRVFLPTRRVKRKRAESPSDDRADTAVPTPTAKSSDTLPAGAGTSNNSAPVQASKSLQTMTRNHVRWTRDFPKISASALEQITSHRHANMFAHPIRERDAPGYHNIVRGPMDLKSIRAAITHGNRAAKQAVANLPNGDPGTSMVWLRKSEDLVPPRGIINITHLDQALTQMFSNAIMYNQDPNRGPGPSFLEELEEPTDDGADASTTAASGGGAASSVLGYKVDENAVVNDTIAMHLEVEKLLENIREAEKQRAAPPPPPVDDEDDKGHYDTNGDTKADHADVETDRAEREGTDATEGETPSGAIASNTGTTKRRRIARG